MLPRGPSLIPGRINAHGLTDEQMRVLDTMELEADRLIPNKLLQPHRGKEGADYGRGGRGRGPFLPGDVLVMVMEIPANLPLDDGLPQQPHHGEHGYGRAACRLLQPHGAERRRILAPTQAGGDGDMLRLLGLEHLSIRTFLGLQRSRQDRPAVHVLRRDQGL
jgi:hypothetical protein